VERHLKQILLLVRDRVPDGQGKPTTQRIPLAAEQDAVMVGIDGALAIAAAIGSVHRAVGGCVDEVCRWIS
jgi:ketol-acid reductoisomerase